MKKLFALLLVLLPAFTMAQSKVDAKEIMVKVNQGESVSYRNETITGKLDLTQLNNRKLKEESKNWPKESSKVYVSTVKVPLQFINCTFTDDVLGYYHLEDQNETNNADFDENVIFENCTFTGKVTFKYSRFEEKISFAGSRFKEEALFKYSHFEESPDFSKTRFEEEANFKYAQFDNQVNFSDATFSNNADFKYAQFPARSSLRNASFTGHANFKYAKFTEPIDLTGVAFTGGEDFKYTKVGGKSFSNYLLNNRK